MPFAGDQHPVQALAAGTGDPAFRYRVRACPQLSARTELWAARLRRAESAEPHEIEHNGWLAAALMAAWSAINRRPVPAADLTGDSSPGRHLPWRRPGPYGPGVHASAGALPIASRMSSVMVMPTE